MRSAHFGQNRGLGRVLRSPRIFCVVARRPFGNFATTDFHQIWPRNVIQCPVDESRKTFSKIFNLGVICPKIWNRKFGTEMSEWWATRQWKKRENIFCHFDKIPVCDRQRAGWTDRCLSIHKHSPHLWRASFSKNWSLHKALTVNKLTWWVVIWIFIDLGPAWLLLFPQNHFPIIATSG